MNTEAIAGQSIFGMHKGMQGIHLRLRLTWVSLFSPYFITLQNLDKKRSTKKVKKSAVLKGDRTQDPSVIVQCAIDYATAASSLDSLLLYLINVTNEISCI